MTHDEGIVGVDFLMARFTNVHLTIFRGGWFPDRVPRNYRFDGR